MAEQPERQPETTPGVRAPDCLEVQPSARPAGAYNTAVSMARKIGIGIAGTVVILAGIVMTGPIPGPGVVIVLAGLAILATEFAFARKLLHRLRDRAKDGASGIRDWWRRFRGRPEQ